MERERGKTRGRERERQFKNIDIMTCIRVEAMAGCIDVKNKNKSMLYISWSCDFERFGKCVPRRLIMFTYLSSDLILQNLTSALNRTDENILILKKCGEFVSVKKNYCFANAFSLMKGWS